MKRRLILIVISLVLTACGQNQAAEIVVPAPPATFVPPASDVPTDTAAETLTK